ncbi:hypothetical protein TrCOL_g2501 [Triparma columacea]|uniref:Uncharacterized protein n=1 Tax=Triparma columacea TaxID=722753 RepID=A0A9W7GKS1_9STRA|nr:hypothetical protein TrCOL_g2501 [Triparma columacea]
MTDESRLEWEAGRNQKDKIAQFLTEVEAGETIKDGECRGYKVIGIGGKNGKGVWMIPENTAGRNNMKEKSRSFGGARFGVEGAWEEWGLGHIDGVTPKVCKTNELSVHEDWDEDGVFQSYHGTDYYRIIRNGNPSFKRWDKAEGMGRMIKRMENICFNDEDFLILDDVMEVDDEQA